MGSQMKTSQTSVLSILGRQIRSVFFYVLAYAVLSSAPTTASAEPQFLTINLTKGETYKWNLRLTKRIVLDGKKPNFIQSTTPITIKVLEKIKADYLIEIQYGSTLFDPYISNLPKNSQTLNDLRKIIEKLRIRVTLTEDGIFQDINNLPELQSEFSKIIDFINNDSMTKDTKKFPVELETSLKTKEGIVFAFLNDLSLLFDGTNVDLNSNKPLQFDSDYLSPISSTPLKLHNTITLKVKDNATQTLMYTTVAEADKEAYAKVLTNIYGNAPKNNSDIDSFKKILATATIKTESISEIDMKTGLARKATAKKIYIAPDIESENGVELTMIR